VRLAVRRLVAKGALRLVEGTKAGHLVEVRLPGEIRAVRANGAGARGTARLPHEGNLEETGFWKDKTLRALYREGRLKASKLIERRGGRSACSGQAPA
jgi:hypothetical protein